MKALLALGPERQSERAQAIEKSLYALARAQAHPVRHERAEKATMLYADPLIRSIVERGAAPLGTTTSTGFAAEIGQNLVGEFLSTLAPLSAAAALIAQGLRVNLGAARDMKLPAREGGPSAEVAWTGEGEPIPVRAYAVNDDCVLSPQKFGVIVGISAEAAKRAGGEAVIRQLLREDAAASLDAAYFTSVAGDAATHPGMLAGATPLVGYPGSDRFAIEADLLALSDAISVGGSGVINFIVSPKRAARFKILAPDLNRELTFVPSLAVGETTIIAVDPLSWAHGAGDDFDLDASSDAIVHMSDDPDPIGDSGLAAPVRSFWQTNSIAMRLISEVAFAARRPNAAAWIQNVAW